nr:transposase [Streptomyces sp. NRRL F-2664]
MLAQLNGLLRQLLREKEGRDAEPPACVIDAQSVKTSTSVPAAGQGIDAGKKIAGRKRSIAADTLGLLLAVLVAAASVQDSVAGTELLDQVAVGHPGIRKAWVGGGCRQHLVEHAATLGIDMEITARKPGNRGFTPIPKRWAVERTYGVRGRVGARGRRVCDHAVHRRGRCFRGSGTRRRSGRGCRAAQVTRV